MSRSLLVIEDECGGIWGVQRERDADFDVKVKRLAEYDPTARVTEYAPLVRCKECRNGRQRGLTQYVGYAGEELSFKEVDSVLCGNPIGNGRGIWHPADWYCADAEAKDDHG